MTDTPNAPERILMGEQEATPLGRGEFGRVTQFHERATEYVRADIHAALQAECDAFEEQLFDAMQLIRHLSMGIIRDPSLTEAAKFIIADWEAAREASVTP